MFALPDPVRQWWLSAAIYSVAALVVVLIEGPGLLRAKAFRPRAEAGPA